MADQFLDAIENLSRFHREHEKFYAQRPREHAVALQRHSRALSALADRWAHVDAGRVEALSPYRGADDLDAPEALQLDGILFIDELTVARERRTRTLGCRCESERVPTLSMMRREATRALYPPQSMKVTPPRSITIQG